ncbi:MarR family winged helix-turn-helix transcriptional regulator [Yoonia sp. R2331]|uniref:MarR family winged helix-turn-helix transcriptional regulator n=1 Tax=Yoonia sp. R2331 TaxID=3237238 RepID=UPI0034E4E633
MTNISDYDLRDFTPYLLNLASETTSLAFQQHYRDTYGMLRTEWRVLFHLGQYGPQLARDICNRARLHKTKVSRAVRALELKRYLRRSEDSKDRRQELLELTPMGRSVFAELRQAAQKFDENLVAQFTPEERATLKQCLARIADL